MRVITKIPMDETLFLGINIEEWFKYHPPETEERKAKHSKINGLALSAGKLSQIPASDAIAESSKLVKELREAISVPELKEWAGMNIAFHDDDSAFDRLMKIQQLRMVANQAATVEELMSQAI